MKVYKVFQRVTPAPEVTDDFSEWQARMEQLLLSDPVELLDFVSDAIIAVAARGSDESEGSFGRVLDALAAATEIPERETVIGVVRDRYRQIQAVVSERTDRPTEEIMGAFHRLSRESAWPE